MRFHNITTDDMNNGSGLRTVLWVAGCEHHCAKCHNSITWDANGGLPFDEVVEKELFEKASKDYIEGITFSGGDPLHPQNREKIGELIEKYISICPDKNIWVYTGYRLRDDFSLENENGETFALPYLSKIDVLVDGRFECETRKKDLQEGKDPDWRGSSNQRLVDVKNRIKQGEIVLFTNY